MARVKAAYAKGSTLLATLEFVRGVGGEAATQAALRGLTAAQRKRVRGTKPTDEIPLSVLLALWHAVDDVLAGERPDWAESAGAMAIDSLGVQLYGGILLKSSPAEFLTQRVSLFRLYYRPGNMEVVEQEPGRAVLRLVGLEPGDPLFCRRQTGGLLRSVELAGGTDATVRHVRCTAQDDAFCEWELVWSA